MSNDSIILSVHKASKRYALYDQPQDRLKDLLFSRFGKKYGREFWALQEVSFDVHRGETFAIIGRNGSGKSTLLQIIAGIIPQTTGTVRVTGKVAALLELGSGFNPEFTGRENIFLNGSILGIPREVMEERYEEIVAFADIGKFIEQPVKFYSSGMFVRLAFAVSTFMDADLLLIDEALAVGDVFFRQKCYRRLEELRRCGTAIILVSHAMTEVQEFCDRALLLHYSEQFFLGNTLEAVNRYYLLGESQETENTLKNTGEAREQEIKPADNGIVESDGQAQFTSTLNWPAGTQEVDASCQVISNGGARCTQLAVCDEFGNPCRVFRQGQTAHFYYEFELLRDIDIPVAGLTIRNDKNILIHGKNTLQYDSEVPVKVPGQVKLRFHHTVQLNLAEGEYTVELGFGSMSRQDYELRASLTSEELANAVSRDCVVCNAAVFAIVINSARKPVNLTHHGICDLPGGCLIFVHSQKDTTAKEGQL